MDASTLWGAVLELLEGKLQSQQIETWFRPLVVREAGRERVRIEVPTPFYRTWFEKHYRGKLEEALLEILGVAPVIELSVLPSEKSERKDGREPEALPQQGRGGGSIVIGGGVGTAAKAGVLPTRPIGPTRPPEARRAATVIGDVQLNPNYTFQEFVTGPSNRVAHAASLAVVETPAVTYNPLFLHGGIGLGKTHLLQAICHAALVRSPDVKIAYFSCEAWVNQYIAAIEKNDIQRFRDRYRFVDMLVIDDIHFLGGKDRSQEELFHTFNTLYTAQKQIILSSDSAPREIPQMEERLVSRFRWGLEAALEPPHFETKVAIVMSKAKARGHELTSDVANHLANSLDGNIRELEGAVTKLLVMAALENRAIDLKLCQEVVRELTAKSGEVSLSQILTTVANHYQLRTADLLSHRRNRNLVRPRQLAIFLARELTHLSLEEIGMQLGGRDHTTILYGERCVRERLQTDADLRALTEKLKRTLVKA